MVFHSMRETGLKMVRGSTQMLEIQLFAPDGQPYVLLEGDVVRFGVKNPDFPGGYLVKKESRKLTDGVTTVTIDPEDTIGMEPGRYWYDVGLQSGKDYFSVVKYSDFILEPNVTWKE